ILYAYFLLFFFFFQAEDCIRDGHVTGVQTCALPISSQRQLALGHRQFLPPQAATSLAHASPDNPRLRGQEEASRGPLRGRQLPRPVPRWRRLRHRALGPHAARFALGRPAWPWRHEPWPRRVAGHQRKETRSTANASTLHRALAARDRAPR